MKSLKQRSISALQWTPLEPPFAGQCVYGHNFSGLRVIESIEEHPDGRQWHHVSCSYANRLPSFADLKMVKELFCGDEATAIQIFPPKSQYVNAHPYVLHLWECLSEDLVPDLRTADGLI